MKKLKLIFINFISVFLVVTSISNINAYETNKNNIEISNMFIEYIDDIFENPNKTTIWNNKKENVTTEFFKELQPYYDAKDYLTIKNYTLQHRIDEMCIDESTIENIKTRSPFVNQLVNKHYFKNVNKAQASGEVEYYLRSSFVWDRANYKITSVGDVNIDITRQYFGNNWTTKVSSMSANSKVSADKYEVTFTGRFNMRAIYSLNNIVIWDIDLGQFSASTTEHPDTFQ